MENKKFFGGYNITKAMGFPLMDYIKIANFLNLINAPKIQNGKKVGIYCLTEKQVNFLKEELRKIEEVLK